MGWKDMGRGEDDADFGELTRETMNVDDHYKVTFEKMSVHRLTPKRVDQF